MLVTLILTAFIFMFVAALSGAIQLVAWLLAGGLTGWLIFKITTALNKLFGKEGK